MQTETDYSCLVPKCKTESKTRGLCATHYMYAHRLVARGKTSWEQLEREGKVLASHSNPNPIKDWFLNGSGEDHIQEEANEPIVVEDKNQVQLNFESEEFPEIEKKDDLPF